MLKHVGEHIFVGRRDQPENPEQVHALGSCVSVAHDHAAEASYPRKRRP